MGLRFQLLAILSGIFFLPSAIALAAGSGCLKCHQHHSEQRGQCVSCHKGNPRTYRVSIAHYGLISAKYSHFTVEGSPVVEQGKKLFETFGCRRCHVSDRKGNSLASKLDRVPLSSMPQAVFDAIKEPVPFMPNFYFKDTQITELVNAIFAGASRTDLEAGEMPIVIHFEDERQAEENVFVKHCGACHRVLTTRLGGLGKGNIGPNLSGLFSEHYPKTYGNKEPWSSEPLKKWLKNPREVRNNTQMAPVELVDDEFARLTEALVVGAGAHQE